MTRYTYTHDSQRIVIDTDSADKAARSFAEIIREYFPATKRADWHLAQPQRVNGIGAADALSARVQSEKARIAALNSAERDMDAGAREQFGLS